LREEHRPRVFENRVLRKIFGPKKEEDGSWRKLHNDELHRMRWAGHGARIRGEVFTGFWFGAPNGKDHWGDLGVSGRITLRWTLGR
jgi:hypothetical protein